MNEGLFRIPNESFSGTGQTLGLLGLVIHGVLCPVAVVLLLESLHPVVGTYNGTHEFIILSNS